MSVTKLENPLVVGGKQIYPLSTTDQIIKLDGTKLETEDGINAENAKTLNGKTENELSVANADTLGGNNSDYFAKSSDVPFSFGIDANGNYGYIKAGADTVTPFSSFKFAVKGQLTSSQYGGTLTLNDCQIGKKYLCIISSWSSGGSSTALTYCVLKSYNGCTYTKLLEKSCADRAAYIAYILTATDTTMVLTPDDAIMTVFE